MNKTIIQRLDGVDMLRGLAIFFVLMNHVNMRLFLAKIPYTTGIPKMLVSAFVWNGQFGVQIFFAVSGFLIASSILNRWGTLSSIVLRKFYYLRFARVAPLLFLLLTVLSIFHFFHLKDFVVSDERGGLARALFAALTFHINVLEAQRGYLPGNWDILWSLSIEEMFYLFFPMLCFVFGRGKLMIWILLLFTVLGPFARTVFAYNEVWQEYSYLGGMDAIALGCLAAILVTRVRLSCLMLRMLLICGVMTLMLILGFSRETFMQPLVRCGLDVTIIAIGACMMMVAFAQTEWRCPGIFRPLCMLGQFSYEIYLTHMFVVFGLFNLFVSLGKPMGAVPVLFVAVILIAGLLGGVVASFFSEPMNNYFRNRWGSGSGCLGLSEKAATGAVI